MCTQPDFYRYLPDWSFPMDAKFKALIKSKSISLMKQYDAAKTDSPTETLASNANPLIVRKTVLGALMEYAIETITLFYDGACKEFGVNCNISDSYAALYLYKCRQYDDVLQLCERILK